jgi:hypothetical protein
MSLLGRLGLASVPDAVVLDELTLDTVAELDVGGSRGDVAAAADAVWFTTRKGRVLSRIDPVTRAETRRLELPERPLVVTADSLGPVVLCERDLVVRANPDGTRLGSPEKLPEGVIDVVADVGAVWALRLAGDSPYDVSLLSLDPGSLTLRREVHLSRSQFAGGLRTGDGVVCALVEDPPGSMRNAVLDIGTGERLPDERAPSARGIAERDGTRWIKDGDRRFKRIEIASGRTLAEGEAPGPDVGSVILAHGCLWACNFRRQRGEPQHMH